ncbi:MAG TPA: hypothetical protein VK421_20725 [Pyrinomonadaceae bacterium]|nr:hypothetical protein [Pyrinomonadaceae bacterium]
MAVKKTDVVPAKDAKGKAAAKANARRMEEFRARAEAISRELSGRKHSDSAALLAEDRRR